MACHDRARMAASGILALALVASGPTLSQQLALQIQDITTPTLQAAGISAKLENGRLTATIGRLSFRGHRWHDIRLDCPKFRIETDLIACDRGTLTEKRSWPVSFSYAHAAKRLELDLRPSAEEHWRLMAHGGKRWEVAAEIRNGSIAYAKPWLPSGMPASNGGSVSGRLGLQGNAAELTSIDASLRLEGVAFSDTSGLHAGETIAGNLDFRADRSQKGLKWEGKASWDQGEIYWHPLYASGSGAQLSAKGHYSPRLIEMEHGVLHWPAIGEIHASASWNREARQFDAARLEGKGLNLGPLFATFALPFLEKTALARSTATGNISFSGRLAGGKLESLDLNMDKASLRDKEARFAFDEVHFTLPWRAHAASMASIDVGSGRVLALPLGRFTSTIHLQDKNISISRLAIPILGGSLNIENFHASPSAQGWRWEFEGGLTPVSMEQLSGALHWPKMHGSLAGVIPRVHYDSGRLAMDGALLVKAFDGTAVIQDLVLLDALGHAPRMQASIDMRNLDLDLLTRAFSFGDMKGRIDVAVKGLELSNWKPVAFDAAVRSSSGDYPRKISQRAVQNISALGGAGAAAAIQRSFLGFFEEFGYRRIGLSCVLKNGVCLMDGVEAAPNGYVIVKGGGIPAITVIGYNRNVSWDELLARLQRVTQGNARPIVQ